MGTPTISTGNLCAGPHSYCLLKVAMNVLSVQASAYLLFLAGRVLWRKWRRQKQGASVSPVAELLDRMVLMLSVVDAIYYIPCMLVLMQGVSPLLILYAPGLDHTHLYATRAPSPNKPPGTVQPLPPPAAHSGAGWTFVWPHCREVVMTLNILLHVYMAWMLREWVVKKRTASQLLRTAPRLSSVFLVGLGVVLFFVALDNVVLHYAGMEGMAWTAMGLNILLFPPCVLYLLFAYFSTARAMQGSGSGSGDMEDLEEDAVAEIEEERGQGRSEGRRKHARMRRRLVRVGVVTGSAWVLGAFTDALVWGSALRMHAAPLQAYPARLITCRLIGIVDALVLAGVVDALCNAFGACLAALLCCREHRRLRQPQQHRSPLALLVGAAAPAKAGNAVAVEQELGLLNQGQEQHGKKGKGKRPDRLPAPLPLQLASTASLSQPGPSEASVGSYQSPQPSPSPLLRIWRSRSLDALGPAAAAGASSAGSSSQAQGQEGQQRRSWSWRSFRPPKPHFGGRSRSLPLPSTREEEDLNEAEEGKQEQEQVAHVMLDLERIVRGPAPALAPPPTAEILVTAVPSSFSLTSSASMLSSSGGCPARRSSEGLEEEDEDEMAAAAMDVDPLFLASLHGRGSGAVPGGLAPALRLWLGTWDLAGLALATPKEALAQLQAGGWVPSGAAGAGAADVYVLGLQRCASVRTARALRRAMARLLPAAEYALVLGTGSADDEGSVHAVLVAARRGLLASGAVALLQRPSAAMVGLRLQDASCAFVAAAVQPKRAEAEAAGTPWQAHHHYPWCEEGDRLLARALQPLDSQQQQQQSKEGEDAEAEEEARLWEVPSRFTHTVLLGSFHTRLRLASPSKDSAGAGAYQGWSWVAQGHDSLARALKGGHLLPGFVEASLGCPPSFPYPPRGPAGGQEAEAGVLWALDGWMRTIAAMRRRPQQQGPGDEEGLPSYPARILVHSLPAAAATDDEEEAAAEQEGSRLKLGAYSLATLVTGSPYKPVSLQAILETRGSSHRPSSAEPQQPQQPQPVAKQQLYEYALELRGFRLEDGEDFGPLSIAGATLAYPLAHLDGDGKAAAVPGAVADPRVDRRVHALAHSCLLSSAAGGVCEPSSPLAAAVSSNGEGWSREDDAESVASSSTGSGSGGWRAALWGGEAQAHCLWRSPEFFETAHDMVIAGLGDRGRVIRGRVSPHGAAQRAAWGEEDEGCEGEKGFAAAVNVEQEDGVRVLRHAVVVAVPECEGQDEETKSPTPARLRQAALRLWALRPEEEAGRVYTKGAQRAALLARHAAQETLGQAGFLLPDLAALAPSTTLATRLSLPLSLHGRRTATLSFDVRVARRPLSEAEARGFAGLPAKTGTAAVAPQE